jgi:hypothetical protein
MQPVQPADNPSTASWVANLPEHQRVTLFRVIEKCAEIGRQVRADNNQSIDMGHPHTTEDSPQVQGDFVTDDQSKNPLLPYR